MVRAHNFNAGPAALPDQALAQAKDELMNFRHTEMSVMELSHRSQDYEQVHHAAKDLLRELLNVPDTHDILLLQGGASLQFPMIPMNFLTKGQPNYILTGSWSEKALKEAKLLAHPYTGGSTKDEQYRRIPHTSELNWSNTDDYIHITSNNTIYGTQWQDLALDAPAPLIADMSSDILSRPFPVENYQLIYAGAQKNLGPSGVTIVIAERSMYERTPEHTPTLLRYDTHADKDSLYHTPPTFAIYMLYQVLSWVKENGGAEGMAKRNDEKAAVLYDTIDNSGGFYTGHAAADSRSHMNVTFNLPSEELNQTFLAEAKDAGFIGLNGHRSVGGCRASIYNAVPLETCEALRSFMKDFQAKHG
ncbi:phosphoserine aminotransferase [Salsuginibacillus halophilus]|uniref:Phosphoserine aminotransferase n=1 Tax=Salsuginibacillus halophilus TaxID=517424 RepID=A0A2P8HG16_9BACI|nr:3-phosphoserine/phosphohydroxythreonine transaminase [Salsuginibacillus halophilus]PSL45155.1 phosphoserine aminotransferase [Salsuginibacillus halophilus]